MKNAVSNKIRLLKDIKPNPDWLQSQRSVLLFKVLESGKKAQRAWSLPGFFAPAFKPVLAFGLVLCLIFGGGFLTVFAAKNSLPGSLFYPVKMVLEDVQMKISSQETQPKLQAEFVGNRVKELTQAVDEEVASPIKKKERVVKAVDKLQTQVVSAKVPLDTIPSEKALIAAKEKIMEEFKEEGSEEVVRAIDAALAVIVAIETEKTEAEPEKEAADLSEEDALEEFPAAPIEEINKIK